jgi:hypothetical protein
VAGVVIALVVAGWVHHERVQAERRDPSFRWGQHVMDETVYPELRLGSVRDACRDAMQNPLSPPPGLNKSRAIDGCVYEETILDD